MMSANCESKLCARGPLAVFLIMFVVLVTDSYSAVQLLSLPSPMYFASYIIIFPLAIIAVVLYICTSIQGPGFVPLRWSPSNNDGRKYLEYCDNCNGYKAPRSHHCRRCGRCVLKLDHHCAFTNGCIGHENEMKFIWCCFCELLFFFHSLFFNSLFLYKAKNKMFVSTPAILPISIYTRYLVILGTSTAFGCIFFVSVIFAVQIKRVVKNKTFIEEKICSQAKKRRQINKDLEKFVFPFDLGWRKNINLIMKRVPSWNGYNWPVREGCNQYSVSIEHMEQKKDRNKLKTS